MQTGPAITHLQHHDRRASARRGGADRGAMSSVEGDRESAAFCAELVRSHDFARYAATLFVPSEQRRALLAVYAFNVEISRVREQVSQPLPGEIRLQWWTDMLAGAGPWRRRGQSGRSRTAARDSQLPAAGRAAVAADRRAPVRSLQRSDADHGGAGGLHQRYRMRPVFARRRVSVADNPMRSSTSRAMPASRRALRR